MIGLLAVFVAFEVSVYWIGEWWTAPVSVPENQRVPRYGDFKARPFEPIDLLGTYVRPGMRLELERDGRFHLALQGIASGDDWCGFGAVQGHSGTWRPEDGAVVLLAEDGAQTRLLVGTTQVGTTVRAPALRGVSELWTR